MASELETRPAPGLLSVAQAREIAEVQAAMYLARQYPRNEKLAMDHILQACTSQELAEEAMYEYVKGGKTVTGPSIRLAEVMAQSWGNFECGVREIDSSDGESRVESYAWDIQTNFRDKKTFKVSHIRRSKGKNILIEDPREIYEIVANQGARRKRACILAVIPKWVQEKAKRQCEETLIVHIEITPEKLKKMLEKFAEFGVTKEQIEARIQRRIDAITPALLVQLGNIYNSINDGMSKADEWFGAADTGPEKGTLSPDDLAPGKEENRGHGRENLAVAYAPLPGQAPADADDDDENEDPRSEAFDWDAAEKEFKKPPQQEAKPVADQKQASLFQEGLISAKQGRLLYAEMRKSGRTEEELEARLKAYSYAKPKDIRQIHFEAFMRWARGEK